MVFKEKIYSGDYFNRLLIAIKHEKGSVVTAVQNFSLSSHQHGRSNHSGLIAELRLANFDHRTQIR